jgi:hypothetical protein
MTEKHRNMLSSTFPTLFANNSRRRMEIACLDGWYDLIYKTCTEIMFYLNSPLGEHLRDNFRIVQIKEKVGSLRIYINMACQPAHDIINKYSKLSEKTCEFCGKEGQIKSHNGWLKAVCKSCEKEQGGYK